MKNVRAQLITLDNGLRVLYLPVKGIDSVAVELLAGAGSLSEPKALAGISHFLEHLFFKGTKRRPSPLAIAREIESVGGAFNAATAWEYTSLFIKTARPHFELALDVLADILQNCLLPEKEVAKERGVILEEIRMYNDLPTRKVFEEFTNLLYGDQPAGWSIAGSEKSVSQISRRQIADYFKSHYFPKNLVLAVAGAVSPGSVKKLTSAYFSRHTGRSNYFQLKFKPPTGKDRLRVIQKPTEQAHFVLGAEGTTLSSPERYPLLLAAAILGFGMDSRLFNQIRDKRGWAYYISSFQQTSLKTGLIGVRAGVKINKTPQAIKLCRQEFENLGKTGPSDQELTKAKEYIKGTTLLEFEDSAQAAFWVGSNLLLEQKVETLAEYFDKIEEVTGDDIRQAVRKYLAPDRLHLALIGPFQSSKDFEKLIS